ncbi:hypothetical protein S40288_10803 [Stachybotrys chartarum IBT 40288]|nr:hypothetical protein S40288_10803 [Stachybotrys chartarum IBT 40288]
MPNLASSGRSPINPRPSDGFDFTDWTSQTRRPLQPVRAPAGAARGRSRCDAGGTRLDWARLQPGWHFLQVVSGDKDFWQRPSAKSNPCRAAAAPPPGSSNNHHHHHRTYTNKVPPARCFDDTAEFQRPTTAATIATVDAAVPRAKVGPYG